ncbi:MAG TPA: hypothetical protein VJW20_03725 [Candidatus Angelobacter sp.]|nr:hypothetical protein [Candidatus Angelobacter sp.]
MFHQFTKCYNHTPGEKPFNKDDLVAFAAGASIPGLLAALASFLTGNFVLGFVFIAIQYAATIIAIANEWLFHRLVCVSGDQCAIGTVESLPTITPLLGAFDNDQFFDIRLMPHRHQDLYKAPNAAFFNPSVNPPGTVPWSRALPLVPGAGPSLDGKTESTPQNDIFLDNFQGSLLLQPMIVDLPYTPVSISDTTITDGLPDATTMTRSSLHCEAEGNFWQAMKDTAALQGTAVGVGAGAGAAAGAAAGCALGGLFGPIGCLIGAIIGFIAGLLAGGAAGAYIAANAAFNSDPGDVNDANVGDLPLGQLNDGDQVVVFGTHVYDGFHTGWHELHPLKAIARFSDPIFKSASPDVNHYLEWNPDATEGIGALSTLDVQMGLASIPFRNAAIKVKDVWCRLLTDRFTPATIANQGRPENRWTIHPAVDGCQPDGPPPPR